MPGRRAMHLLGAAVLALACGGTSTNKAQPGAAAGSSGGGRSGAAGDAATAGSAGAMGGGAAGSAGKGELVAGKGGMGDGGTGEEAGGGGDAGEGSGGDAAGASSGGGGAGGASAGAGGAEGGAGGSTAGSAGAGMAGAGAEAGNPTFPPKPLCGGEAGNLPWCSGIENVRIELTSVVDESGDGNVSPGEQLSFVFTLQNEGTGFVNSPCLGLLSDDPDVEILGGRANDNPAWELFGIAAGVSVEMTLRARVGENVLAGRRLHFLAWMDVLRAGCTNGTEIQFELTVD